MRPAPVLVADMGNTSVSFALAWGERVGPVRRLPTHGTSARQVFDALAALAQGHPVRGGILCSVAPALNRVWLKAFRQVTGAAPLLVQHALKLNVGLRYPQPERLGADRVANACGAVQRYGAPVIVADFGTALTFDIVDRNRNYLGGIIAPGLSLMTDYLAERTALLPRLDLRRYIGSRWSLSTMNAIGRSTEEAMLIGARLGYLGLVRECLARVRRDLGERRVAMCATGGYAQWAVGGSDLNLVVDPDLTLFGIKLIYDLNAET